MEEIIGSVAAIGFHDLSALSSILYFYERWLHNTLAPSARRSKQLAEVQLLLVKISLLGTSKIAMITFEEVEYINAAIKVFSTQVREKIPSSKNRDDVLESCEGLHQYIAKTFAPPAISTEGLDVQVWMLHQYIAKPSPLRVN